MFECILELFFLYKKKIIYLKTTELNDLIERDKILNLRNTCHLALRDLTALNENENEKSLKFGKILLTLHSMAKSFGAENVCKMFFGSFVSSLSSLHMFFKAKLNRKPEKTSPSSKLEISSY